MRGRLGGLIALAWGCGPGLPADSAAPDCFDAPPPAGVARVKYLTCSSETVRNGDGRGQDILLQNAEVNLVIRAPGAALSLVGAPGGTILDFAPHGWNDRLIEAVPIVDGRWIAAESLDFGVDEAGAWLTLRGPLVAVVGVDTAGGLDERAFERGEEASITYRLAPDSQVLAIEGADGLYLHGTAGTEPVRGGQYHTGLAYLTNATAQEDAGGALRLDGADRLAVGTWAEAPGSLDPAGPRASGQCSGDHVEIYARGGVLLGFLGADFDQVLPADAETLVCVAEGHAPGTPTPVGEGLSLEPGGEGWLWLRVFDDDANPIPALVRWSDGAFALPPEGAPVPLGAGRFALTVSHGPAYEPLALTAEASDGPLTLTMRRSIRAEGWTQADLWRQAAPSREARELPAEDLRLAAAEGARFVVQAALDEVGTPSTDDWEGRYLRARAGSLARTESAGEVLTWSWTGNRRYPGHGAVPWFGLGATDLLAVAMSYGLPDRIAVVDATWAEAAGLPVDWEPRPDLMRLHGTEDLPVYFEALRRGARWGVVGPVTWIHTGVEGQVSASACEQGLVLGRTVAGSGPLVVLDAVQTGAVAGTVLAARLEAPRSAAVRSLEIWVDGERVGSWPITRPDDAPFEVRTGVIGDFGWAVAVVVGEDWAVTAPLWSP